MSGDFDLGAICRNHENVIFDISGLYAPFKNSLIRSAYDSSLKYFAGMLTRLPKCKIPEAALHVLNQRQKRDPIAESLSDVLKSRTMHVGYKHQKLLRANCLELAQKYRIDEQDRHSILLALALARDTVQVKGASTAYITSVDNNVSMYKELRTKMAISAEKALPYKWNAGKYVPVLDAIKA